MNRLSDFIGMNKQGPPNRHHYHEKLANVVRDNSAYFAPDKLLDQGLLENNLYVSSSGISHHEPDDMLGSAIVGPSTSEVRVWPIRINLFVHNPTTVRNVSTTTEYRNFNFSWTRQSTGEIYNFELIYAVPNLFEVIVPAEMEFKIKRQFVTSLLLDILSFGVTCALYDGIVTEECQSDQFELAINCHQDWLKRKGRIMITISNDAAESFTRDVAKLVRLQSSVPGCSLLKSLSEIPSPCATGIFGDAFILPNSVKISDTATQKALLKILETRSSTLRQFPSYQAMANIPTTKNTLLGFAFEEIIAGRIMNAADKQGIQLTRIAGDGHGALPNGQTTPVHSDLVFLDTKTGNYHSYQMKFSDKANSIRQHIKSYAQKHAQLGGNTPPELHFENTEVIIPQGITVDPVDVALRDATGTKVGTTRLKISSKIKVGEIYVDAPTPQEMHKLLQDNYEILQKINNEGFVSQRISGLKDIKKARNEIENMMVELEKIPSTSEESKANVQKKIEKINEELKQAQEQLEQVEKHISKDTDVLSDEGKSLFRKQKLMLLRDACLVGAMVDGGISLVKSLHSNISSYMEGNITFMELTMNVSKDTGVACVRGALISAAITTPIIMGEWLALSTSPLLSTTGSVFAKGFGPSVFLGLLAYQVSCLA